MAQKVLWCYQSIVILVSFSQQVFNISVGDYGLPCFHLNAFFFWGCFFHSWTTSGEVGYIGTLLLKTFDSTHTAISQLFSLYFFFEPPTPWTLRTPNPDRSPPIPDCRFLESKNNQQKSLRPPFRRCRQCLNEDIPAPYFADLSVCCIITNPLTESPSYLEKWMK